MQDLIKQLRDSKRVKDGIPMPPSSLDLRAANALEKQIQVINGLRFSRETMERELSDAQIAITRLQVALANKDKELKDVKENYTNKQPIDDSGNTVFHAAANECVDKEGTEVSNG